MMQLLGDSWYARELGIPTIEDEPLPGWVARRLGNSFVRGIALWWCGRRYDRVVLSDGGLTFRILMLLERLWPRNLPYLVLLEFRPVPLRPWASVGRSQIRLWLRTGYQRWVVGPVLRSGLARAHTLSSWEVERNAGAFGVAAERFVFIPFPLTATGDELPALEGRGRRVLASGRALCDWPLVFAAAERQPWDLEIVCGAAERSLVERLNADGRARVWCDIPLPAHQDLLREVAVYLLPLLEAEVSSGHMRLFDATRGGAPVVAADVRGLADYAWHGETALLFPPGDALAAREAVNRLLDDRELADQLRRSAFACGQQRTRDQYMDRIRTLIFG
jgi:Glycosyl transferases group 1